MGSLVSVGIPTFNRYDFLKRALKIITEQSYKNIEIIISDNCSSDLRVQELCLEYQLRDSRIRYYRQIQNIGILKNTEYVLKRSSGTYFMWFSDDDWRHPDFIKILVDNLENNENASCAFCDFQEVNSEEEIIDRYPSTHLKYLNIFTSKCKWLRQVRYFLQDSRRGKQNIFYSIFRRSDLNTLNLERISYNYTFLQMDNMIAYSMLGKGFLHLDSRCLLKLTCENKKEYKANVIKRSLFQRCIDLIFFQNIESYALYSNGETLFVNKILFFLLWPYKIFFIFITRVFFRR